VPTVERFVFTSTHMGAPCRIVVYSDSAATAEAGAAEAFARIHALDQSLSDYDPDSELSRLCAVQPPGPVPVSTDLFEVLWAARDLHDETEGAFDPTVGPLVRLWRRARRLQELPNPARLREALDRTGMKKVALDDGAQTVHLTTPGMRLDLGGIGKGYAADQALEVLREAGLPIALVDLGGDLALGAAPPQSQGWKVRASPLGDDDPNPLYLLLAEVGVATSGDVSRFTEIDGVRYSHIVDPRTGFGVTTGVGASVVAEDATTADALASALAVMGEGGLEALRLRFPDFGAVLRFAGDGRTVTAGSIAGF